jgi:uncharacterized membrane protein
MTTAISAVHCVPSGLRELVAALAAAHRSSQVHSSDRRVRFPGIIEDARRLKVSRIHLYLVLSGQRQSRRLLSRYHALRQKSAA